MAMKVRFLQVTAAMIFILVTLCSALDYGYNPPAKELNRIQGEVKVLPENIKAGNMQGEHKHEILRGHRKGLSMDYTPDLTAKLDDSRPTAPGHSPGIGHTG